MLLRDALGSIEREDQGLDDVQEGVGPPAELGCEIVDSITWFRGLLLSAQNEVAEWNAHRASEGVQRVDGRGTISPLHSRDLRSTGAREARQIGLRQAHALATRSHVKSDPSLDRWPTCHEPLWSGTLVGVAATLVACHSRPLCGTWLGGVMALVVCPECRSEVSDQALACPRCGLPHPSQTRMVAPPPLVPRIPPPAWTLAEAAPPEPNVPQEAEEPTPPTARPRGRGVGRDTRPSVHAVSADTQPTRWAIPFSCAGVSCIGVLVMVGFYANARTKGLVTTKNVGDFTDAVAAEVGIKTTRASEEERQREERAKEEERRRQERAKEEQTRREEQQRWDQAGSERGRTIGEFNDAFAAWEGLIKQTTAPSWSEAVRTRDRVLAGARQARAALQAQQRVADASLLTDIEVQFGNIGGIERVVEGARIVESVCHANRDWESVGASARPGEAVYVWGVGEWKAGPRWQACGPDGTGAQSALGDFRLFHGNAPFMALITRTSGQEREGTAFVGGQMKFVAPTGGDVQVRCNDNDVRNNEGSVRVLVIVQGD